eukprot:6436156-Lingulodinium_polyedra.AAC.1
MRRVIALAPSTRVSASVISSLHCVRRGQRHRRPSTRRREPASRALSMNVSRTLKVLPVSAVMGASTASVGDLMMARACKS